MAKGVGLKTEQMYLITLRPFTIERGATAIGARTVCVFKWFETDGLIF